MKTSTADANNYVCPECGDQLAQDHVGRGFVRHRTNPNCDFERGERDHDETETD
ncbi:hypothetical protein ACFL9U_06510 [Thermodesulfobacteriota bacterium]